MRVLLRLLLALVVLAGLAGLAAAMAVLVPVPYVSDTVRQMFTQVPWLPLAVAIVLLAFFVLALGLLFFVILFPPRRHIFAIRRENMGRLEVTRQGIASAAGHAVDEVPGVKRHTVHVGNNPRPGKLKLDIVAETYNDEDFAELAGVIDAKVRTALGASLGMKPGHIKVRIERFDLAAAEKHPGHAPPRVV